MCEQLIIVESLWFLCERFQSTIDSVIFKLPGSKQLELWLDLISPFHIMSRYFPSHFGQVTKNLSQFTQQLVTKHWEIIMK